MVTHTFKSLFEKYIYFSKRQNGKYKYLTIGKLFKMCGISVYWDVSQNNFAYASNTIILPIR